MILSLDENQGIFQIKNYQRGKITINETVYTHSLILTSNQLIDHWPPQAATDITAADIEMIQSLSPEVVIIGTGEKQLFLSSTLLLPLTSNHIGVEVMNTAAACRTYHVLMAEDRNAAFAFIL